MSDFDFIDDDEFIDEDSLDDNDDLDNDTDDEDSWYSTSELTLVGFDELKDEDKDFVCDELENEAHLYIRYDSIKKRIEFLRQSNVVGYAPDEVTEPLRKANEDEQLGAVIVKSIGHTGSHKGAVTVTLYIKDKDGFEMLPFYPIEGRNLTVIETEFWKGEKDWSQNWDILPLTDELSYKFPELYENEVNFEELSITVYANFLSFQTGFLNGQIRSKSDIYIFSTIEEAEDAKKVLLKRIDSYLSHKGWSLSDDDSDETVDDNDSHQEESYTDEDKYYDPHFLLSYKNEDGEYINKTIKNSNFDLSIVGMKYRDNFEELKNVVKEGTELIIKRDPENEYDSTALGFYLNDGTLVGYVPKKDKPFVELFFTDGELGATVSYAGEGNVDCIILLSQTQIDERVISKYDIKIRRSDKHRINGVYQESSTLTDIDDLKDFLEV